MRERWPDERRSVAPNQRWLLSSLRVLRGIELLLVISCSPSARPRSPCVFAPRLPDKAQDGAALEHLLGHEILERGHLHCLIRDLVGKVRGHDNNSFAIANDHIAGKDRRIAAADRPIDLDRLMQREVGRSRRTVVIRGERKLSQLRRVAKAAVRDDPGAAADHEAGYQDGACGSSTSILAAVDDEHGSHRPLLDRHPLRMVTIAKDTM